MNKLTDDVSLYVLKGDETLLASELKSLLKQLVKNHSYQLSVEEVFWDSSNDINRFLENLLTPSFFTERKICVLREYEQLTKDQASKLLEYLDEIIKIVTLVVVLKSTTNDRTLLNKASNVGKVIIVDKPSGRDQASWVKAELKKKNLHVDSAGIALILDTFGADLSRLESLTEILISRFGDKANLTASDISPYLGQAGNVMLWKLTDAIDKGNNELALELLSRLLNFSDRHPLEVLVSLYNHYKASFSLEGSKIVDSKSAKEYLAFNSEFRAKAVLDFVHSHSFGDFSRIFSLVSAADFDLRGKTGLSNQLVLEILTARLCQLSRQRQAKRTRSSRS